WSRCCATTARAIRASCSTRSSCAPRGCRCRRGWPDDGALHHKDTRTQRRPNGSEGRSRRRMPLCLCGEFFLTMAEHPNAIRVRPLFAAFRAGDIATIQALIPEDAAWHFPGRRGRLAGSHRGRDAIFAFLLNVQALTDNTFHLDLIDVIANDAHAVALFRGHG